MLKLEIVNPYGANSLLLSIEGNSVVLDPSEVDALIENLSGYRSEMQPAVDASLSKSRQYVIENNPTWHIESNPLLDGAVVFMRHTGFGWKGFAIPRESLKKLIDVVSTYAGGGHESSITHYGLQPVSKMPN
ncbi:hypothetical protein [Pararobbsia alpina]|uniref:Uncharacterized protein n=1 Tax=Pararobbsia alpina TaxID=621374 RepID=A0A6S7B133_9BURK|nr:hypothetical protein [Pararobbsia alpina]CAB3783661.1 hypothetical protein LMG28138_01685 [Pararobbsia alpina]